MMIWLLILFLIVYTIEGYTTILGVQRGITEANPLMRKLYDKIGVVAGVLLTHVPVSFGTVYAVVIERASLTFLLLLLVPFSVLTANNLYWLWKHRE